jgi:hypothetical protein
MTRLPITNLFNAYDLQVNPLDEDKIRSQEVVNYCEARFRVALQEMMKRSEQDQHWMSTILYREMVVSLHIWFFNTDDTHFRNYVFRTSVWQLRSANR